MRKTFDSLTDYRQRLAAAKQEHLKRVQASLDDLVAMGLASFDPKTGKYSLSEDGRAPSRGLDI